MYRLIVSTYKYYTHFSIVVYSYICIWIYSPHILIELFCSLPTVFGGSAVLCLYVSSGRVRACVL